MLKVYYTHKILFCSCDTKPIEYVTKNVRYKIKYNKRKIILKFHKMVLFLPFSSKYRTVRKNSSP